jgi:hypothetical protein
MSEVTTAPLEYREVTVTLEVTHLVTVTMRHVSQDATVAGLGQNALATYRSTFGDEWRTQLKRAGRFYVESESAQVRRVEVSSA